MLPSPTLPVLQDLLRKVKGNDDADTEHGGGSPRRTAQMSQLMVPSPDEERAEAVVVTCTLAFVVDHLRRDSHLEMTLQTLQRGSVAENRLTLPPAVAPGRLDGIVQAFVDSVLEQSSKATWCQELPTERGREHDLLHQFELETRKGHRLVLSQVRLLRQWHSNACGYHALFDALCLLGFARPCEHDFWVNVLRWQRMLAVVDNKHKASVASLGTLVVDQRHAQTIIDHDARLLGRTTLLPSVDYLEKDRFDRYAHSKQARRRSSHAYILGCVSHWTMCMVDLDGNLWYSDSFGKPTLSLLDAVKVGQISSEHVGSGVKIFESVTAIADDVLEQYATRFCEKLRSLHPFYKHAPQEMLDSFYEDGIQEFWRGKEKMDLYWAHRPRRVRHALLVHELEAALGFLDLIVLDLGQDDTSGSSPHDDDDDDVSGSMKTASLVEYCDANASEAIPAPSDRHPTAVVDVTNQAEFRGYIRRDEDWPEDSEEYRAGNGVENRKKPPKDEIPGDVFDRQRVVVDFDQALVERQVCLLVGTGGVGQNTALALARLGVETIILLDFDQVDASNLTRQCLVGKADVGTPKVEAARRSLDEHHSLRSTVLTFHGDVLHFWPTVVAFAREATAIFNCADVGLMFDYCLNALAKELRVPLVTGQSFAWKFMTELYSGAPEESCAFCQETTRSSFGLQNLGRIAKRWDDFVAANREQPPDAILWAFLVQDPQFRLKGPTAEAIVRELLAEGRHDVLRDGLEPFLNAFHEVATARLQPGQISSCSDLGFIPRPVLPETRFFGSWVCPCLACGTLMVSHWMNFLSSPGNRDPPSHIVFNMDECMTVEEQMGYELGIPLMREDRSFVRSTKANPSCSLCNTAQRLDTERSLYFGEQPVFLKPVNGNVFQVPQFLDELGEGEPPVDQGADTGGLVFPQVPARPRVLLKSATRPLARPAAAPHSLMSLPLLKVSRDEAWTSPSWMPGFASGKRSAIVPAQGRFFRLKGCGNLDEGFPVEVHGDHGERMVRGCLFENTSATEMHMSLQVLAELGRHEVPAANEPVCFYRYGSKDGEACDVAKFCNVYETRGDRRLGDHLLRGLEELLPKLFCEQEGDEAWLAQVEKALLQGRGLEADNPDAELWDTSMAVECGMSVANLVHLDVRESTRELREEVEAHPLWAPSLDALESCLRAMDVPSSVLLTLARALGHECGRVCRILQDAGISWGTYPDATGVHCNAHANNMVVIPPKGRGSAKGCLLAPLDFDMAFSKEGYLASVVAQAHQKMFPKTWEDLLHFEQQMGMRTSLAGSDFTSTGVSNCSAGPGLNTGPLESVMRKAFRDTLVHGFDTALSGAAPLALPKMEETMQRGVDALVCLALIKTRSVVC